MKHPRAVTAALPACLALASLSACASFDRPADSVDPRPVHSPAETFEPAEAGGGMSTADGTDEVRNTVDPGWDIAAQEADGVFLSMHEEGSALEFRAVDSSGEVLWTAKRPRVCSGFLVSPSQAGPVAILMDQQATAEGSLSTTASGFDLATGEDLWGPTEVPGPLLGSGLVFAGPPQDFIGEGGPRAALNPATGQRLATEDADSPQVITLLGDHLVLAEGDRLIGEDLAGNQLWSRPAQDFGVTVAEVRDMPWEAVGDSHALIGSAGHRERTLIDLRTGDEVATGIDDAGYDERTATLVTADSKLHGFDLDGAKRWDAPLADGTELSAVGAGLVVTETDMDPESSVEAPDGDVAAGIETVSAADGRIRTSPDLGGARFGAPHHIAETGARLVGDPNSPLLVTGES